MPIESVKDESGLLRLGAFSLSAVAALLAFAGGTLRLTGGGGSWVTGLLILAVAVLAGFSARESWTGRLVLSGAAALVGGLTLAFTQEITSALLLLLAGVLALLSDELARQQARQAQLPVVLGQAR